ncbi:MULTISPECIES: hypothetical protein [unclassified Cyanobium]|uniref:hypothetical protein n=1 Tax=unclassified Cyanobium TaxID=2627006 RepID=UPI0020CBCA6A|nr:MULTISPECIES: hypothetical protein [unclassified Cyanobium]MCP9777831.1 hypothetical protein [Cyanobium sp. Tous-M-B4]MCP9876729.1 hypothetical protein [Cyanobium sp. A2C-AMD]
MEPGGRGFLPEDLRHQQQRSLLLVRLWSWIKRPRTLLALLALVDLGVAGAVGLWTSSLTLMVLAALPLVLAPALGGLAYWLLWQDFNR